MVVENPCIRYRVEFADPAEEGIGNIWRPFFSSQAAQKRSWSGMLHQYGDVILSIRNMIALPVISGEPFAEDKENQKIYECKQKDR